VGAAGWRAISATEIRGPDLDTDEETKRGEDGDTDDDGEEGGTFWMMSARKQVKLP
jgi:hypothetical protein